MCDVLMFGEPMALFVAERPGSLEEVDKYTRSVSGAEVNVSIGLTRMGYKVAYVTRLGDDTLGRFIASFLKKENLNTRYIRFDPEYKTGIQLKSKERNGDAVAPYFRKDSAATKMSKEILNEIDLTGIKLIHITGIPLALSSSFRELIYETIRVAKRHGIFVSFDPNLRVDLWESKDVMRSIVLDVCKQVDLFLPGFNETQLLTGIKDVQKTFDFFSALGVDKMVMKMGPEGAYVMEGNQKTLIPGFRVEKVIDTVGAGDGFASGLLSGYLDGLSLVEATRRGNAVGAIQVTHWSDNEALPTREELDYFMKKYQ